MPRVKEQFSALRRCKFWPEAERKLREGLSPTLAADFLRANGDYTHANRLSVVRQLERWLSAEGVKQKAAQNYLEKATEGVQARVNEVELFDRLIAYQVQRLEYDAAFEARMKKTLDSQRKEIAALADLLERAARLKMDMGLLPKVAAKVDIKSLSLSAQLSDKPGASIAGLLESDNPALRQLVGALYGQKRLPAKRVQIAPAGDGADDE